MKGVFQEMSIRICSFVCHCSSFCVVHFPPILSGTVCGTDHSYYVNYRLLGSQLDEILLGRWLHIVGSCQCSCCTLLRSSHRALSCASHIIFHKWIVCTQHLLPCTYSDCKRMELCQFSVKFGERPEYFEWLFSPFHSFEVCVLFVFLL